jgi:hypothetical protein
MKSIDCTNNLCQRNIESIELSISENQPKILKVININMKVYTQSFKIINSVSDKKLIINGIRYFNIFYISEKNDKKIYGKIFKVPFCVAVPYNNKFKFLKVDTEYTKIMNCNYNTINLCIISLLQMSKYKF